MGRFAQQNRRGGTRFSPLPADLPLPAEPEVFSEWVVDHYAVQTICEAPNDPATGSIVFEVAPAQGGPFVEYGQSGPYVLPHSINVGSEYAGQWIRAYMHGGGETCSGNGPPSAAVELETQ
jgi:hypothetical protein